RAQAYPDPIYGWEVGTIGYGTTKYPDGTKVRINDIITRAEAEEYLAWEVEEVCKPALEKIPTWSQMNENQRGALYSFAYNLGANFYRGTNFNSITQVCDSVSKWADQDWVTKQFEKYRNPGSAAEVGLRRRRCAEAQLFCKFVKNSKSVQSTTKEKKEVTTVTFAHSTWLKSKPIQSSELWDNQKSFVNKDEKIKVIQILPDAKQHTLLTLENPRLAVDSKTSLEKVYAYTPHLQYKQPKNVRVKKLDVPYFSQVDNDTLHFGAGSRQCNLTSCAMFLAALKPELMKKAKPCGYKEFESYYGETLAKYGDTTDHEAQTKALRDFGVETYFSYTLSHADLMLCLQAGYPVVLGVAYKSSGHMVVATGFNLDKEQIYIHDPFGIRYGASNAYEIGANGAYDPYSFHTLDQIWLDMGEEAGWGRIPLAIDGKPTGLPYDL
ncbi:glycoside hydrolase family protein, partial [Okeania sp.]|uniref:glycoside hydrolase family protein n=1 Tax=Okeania sp. TaxID=3100323 RepID=UPI002B4B8C57